MRAQELQLLLEMVRDVPELERATAASREGREAAMLGNRKRWLLIGTRKVSK